MNTFKQFCVSETDKTTWTCKVVTQKGQPTTAKCKKRNPPVAIEYNMFERDKNGEYTLVEVSEYMKTTDYEYIPKSYILNEEEKGLLDIYIKTDGKPVIISADNWGMVYIRFTPSNPVDKLRSYDILLNTDRSVQTPLTILNRLKSVQPKKKRTTKRGRGIVYSNKK